MGKRYKRKTRWNIPTEYDLVFQENAKTKTITHPWEECRGIGGSFGYNRAEQSKIILRRRN